LLRAALIDAADPASCQLVSERFDPSSLFCGAAAGDPQAAGGTACFGDSGGPAFALENTVDNKRISHAFRGIATNCWVRFGLQPGRRFSGWVCAQGADATAKQSNLACARDVVSWKAGARPSG
jgi:hypothetical protein